MKIFYVTVNVLCQFSMFLVSLGIDDLSKPMKPLNDNPLVQLQEHDNKMKKRERDGTSLRNEYP